MSQIRPVDPKDELFSQVEGFIEAEYRLRGFVERIVNSPDLYMVAFVDDQIVGAMGLFTSSDFDNLPSIRGPTGLFTPDNGLLRGPRLHGLVVEIGRFVIKTTNIQVTKALIVAMHRHLLSRGFVYAIACMKPYLVKHLASIGVTINDYPSSLNISYVPEEYMGYYGVEPFPRLYYFDLQALIETVDRMSDDINARDSFTFESS